MDRNQSENDSVFLKMELNNAEGTLDVLFDDVPKEIFDLWGNGPASIPNSDGEALRLNLFNGYLPSSYQGHPGMGSAALAFELHFCLSAEGGDNSQQAGASGGGGNTNGGTNVGVPYHKVGRIVPYLGSTSEIIVHPTVVPDPNGDLLGISIDNFEAKGNNIVYVRILAFLDANQNLTYDGNDLALSFTPFTSLRVKLDKDGHWEEDF